LAVIDLVYMQVVQLPNFISTVTNLSLTLAEHAEAVICEN